MQADKTGRVRAVIFDMDNTLFDFIAAKRTACRALIGYLGLDTDPDEFLAYFLRPTHGFESHEHIRDFLNDTGSYSPAVFTACCALYEEKKLAAVAPYPNIGEMLCSLRNKGLKLAVVTDAHNGNAAKRLEKAGLLGYFDAVITAEMSGRPKPAPDSFLLALGMLGVQPGHTVLVGDSIHREIGPGNNLGMITIYAAYGDRWYREGEDGGARHIVHDVREIGTVIDHHLIER